MTLTQPHGNEDGFATYLLTIVVFTALVMFTAAVFAVNTLWAAKNQTKNFADTIAATSASQLSEVDTCATDPTPTPAPGGCRRFGIDLAQARANTRSIVSHANETTPGLFDAVQDTDVQCVTETDTTNGVCTTGIAVSVTTHPAIGPLGTVTITETGTGAIVPDNH